MAVELLLIPRRNEVRVNVIPDELEKLGAGQLLMRPKPAEQIADKQIREYSRL